MIRQFYLCHACMDCIEKQCIAEDRFFPRACDKCGEQMIRVKESELLETWPGPHFPPPAA